LLRDGRARKSYCDYRTASRAGCVSPWLMCSAVLVAGNGEVVAPARAGIDAWDWARDSAC
jgi:hypothetical protein